MSKICSITYEPIASTEQYSQAGLKLLSPRLKLLKTLPLDASQLRKEALKRAHKLSIQGVQSKLSAKLNVAHACFELVDKGGTYILKPQHQLYEQAPENEDLTMRCAAAAGIEVPIHGLVCSRDGSLTYFIKRFDRYNKNKKYAVEDFAQLAQKNRETKYDFSMEKMVPLVDTYTTFPMLEKAELLKRILVNFLLGNEDMHLKNYSVITKNAKVTLAPAYDFINSTIALPDAKEQIALTLNGKKSNLKRKDFIDYYAKEKLQLNDTIIEAQLKCIQLALPTWRQLIEASFLSPPLKEKYLSLLHQRLQLLDIS